VAQSGGHAGHSHGEESMSDGRLVLAVALNVLLTVARSSGGILSGSLALIADALHNFSDAASLGLALFARRIGRRPADKLMTFGYARAEVVAALINLTTLLIIGFYLLVEAINRFADPQPVEGWTVIWVAGIALVIDVVTAVMVYASSKNSLNMKAAFLHNVSDALASVGVIVAGVLILRYELLYCRSDHHCGHCCLCDLAGRHFVASHGAALDGCGAGRKRVRSHCERPA